MITTGRPRAEIPFARALNLIYAYGTSAASQMLGVAETTLRKRVAEKGFRIVGGRNLAPLGDPVSKPPATVATRPRVKFQPDKCSPRKAASTARSRTAWRTSAGFSRAPMNYDT